MDDAGVEKLEIWSLPVRVTRTPPPSRSAHCHNTPRAQPTHTSVRGALKPHTSLDAVMSALSGHELHELQQPSAR